MALERALLTARVSHARQWPKKNAFTYGVYYLCFALGDLLRLPRPLLSLNRLNLFSFHTADHADGQPLELWIRTVLHDWQITEADGEVLLLTLPRLFGYVFNPVSFWFCLDRAGNLRAVLSEVTNTYGDRHCYLSFHDDRRPIAPDDRLRGEKLLHVSPFMDVSGHYLFRFVCRDDKIGVWIDHYDQDRLMLTTSLVGTRIPLDSKNLLTCFFRYPLVTLKVISLIHFQAIILMLKGVRFRPRPLPPTTEVSR